MAKRKPHQVSSLFRKQHATVHVGGKDKYPIGNKATARAALRRENQAKPPLTAAQRATVEREAHRYLDA